MKNKTRDLAKQVQHALLALSDATLSETLTQWLDQADEELDYLDWSDEYRYMLGYYAQSADTGVIYSTFELLHEAEPDESFGTWVVPPIEAIRSRLTHLSPEDFYHTVLSLAGHALHQQAYDENWGQPPSVISDGYDFMRCLTVHLCYKQLEGQELGSGHVTFSRKTSGKRRPMKHSSSDLACWHVFPDNDNGRMKRYLM